MKKLLLVILVLLTKNALALDQVRAHVFDMGGVNIGDGACHPFSLVTMRMRYGIKTKLSKDAFELIGLSQFGNIFHGIITTVQTKNPAAFMGIQVKYLGSKNMEMQNGFTQPVDLWKECSK